VSAQCIKEYTPFTPPSLYLSFSCPDPKSRIENVRTSVYLFCNDGASYDRVRCFIRLYQITAFYSIALPPSVVWGMFFSRTLVILFPFLPFLFTMGSQ